MDKSDAISGGASAAELRTGNCGLYGVIRLIQLGHGSDNMLFQSGFSSDPKDKRSSAEAVRASSGYGSSS